jgi:tetratricopeptide (TPR) repeat protein
MNVAAPRSSAARSAALSRVRALIIDENATARQALRNLLTASGIGQVQQAGDPIRGIRMMESERFGLVLCELKFRAQMDGLQVLEYVRTRRLLDPAAAFVMVSGDADRGAVAAAREWQPDGFVLKPLSAESLAPRIEQALRRRALLAPIYSAAERGDPLGVLAFAEQVVTPVAEGTSLELMRWRTQALVDLRRFEEARVLAEQALSVRADLPWAALAIAHADRAAGCTQEACERLRATIAAHPLFGGAYDLLVEILQAQGRTGQALEVARSALEQIATSRRARTLGELAFAHGEFELAEKCYADVIKKTSTSLTRSALDVGMLGQVFLGQGESDKALRLVTNPTLETSGDAPSQALAASVQAQAHAAKGDLDEAAAAARRALALASSGEPTGSVALLVARGAFSAGLREEAEDLVRRTMADAESSGAAGASGALARKVIGEAGLDPGAFGLQDEPEDPAPAEIDDADAPAAEEADAPAADDPGRHPAPRASDAAPAAPRARDAAPAPRTRDPGPADAGGAPARDSYMRHVSDAPAVSAAEAAAAFAAACVERALSAMHEARFDEAVRQLDRAIDRQPDAPAVLMASVQIHLSRMQAQGFDEAAAAEVRRCLAALDRRIPGERRVFPGLA